MELQELNARIKHLYWDACSDAGGSSFLDKDHKFLRELGAKVILGSPKGPRKGFSVVNTQLHMGDIEAYRKGIRVRRNTRVMEMGGYPIFLEFPIRRAERMILLGWPV